MTRIAIAGFQHETNTFGATKASFHDFEIADSWPRMLIAGEVIPGTAGINLPIAGFAEAAAATSVGLVPILWCAAEPCAHVTDDAFERISGMILDGLREAGPLDGIYLDLHGAMVTESHADGEAELLARIRAAFGPELPVVISLDLHANISPRLAEHASAITIFRTYPHLDMAETGARAFAILKRLMAGDRLCKAFRQVPFMIPMQAQFTGVAPCREIYAAIEAIGPNDGASADIAMGFPPADIPDVGPSVVAYAPSQNAADQIADGLLGHILGAEPAFDGRLWSPEDAVAAAMASQAGKPVVLADVQDNPGAGATADTTGVLTALVEGGAQGAVLALLADPGMAALAHQAGIGAQIDGPLGGKSGLPGLGPFEGRFLIEGLSDGHFAFTGEMYRGAVAQVGPCAVLRVIDDRADVRVVVSSQRSQCLDQAIFTHIGIDPAEQRILAVKSTVHYRADFDPIAARVIAVEAPGAHPCQVDKIPYTRLRPGMRLG